MFWNNKKLQMLKANIFISNNTLYCFMKNSRNHVTKVGIL